MKKRYRVTDHRRRRLATQGRLELAVRSMLCPSGASRDENQDNYLVIDTEGVAHFLYNERATDRPVRDWREGHMRLAILDGMGGHSRGREVAELTIEGLLEIAPASGTSLTEALLELHTRLRRQLHSDEDRPGCTLTLLEVPPEGNAFLFHAGDSRLYRVDETRVECLTIDHVPATHYVLHFDAPPERWREVVHDQSGYLLCQAFVLGNLFEGGKSKRTTLYPDLFELNDANLPPFLEGLGDRRPLALERGQVYVLATDGLWGLSQPGRFVASWPKLLCREGRALPDALNALFRALQRRALRDPSASGDNATAIAFRMS